MFKFSSVNPKPEHLWEFEWQEPGGPRDLGGGMEKRQEPGGQERKRARCSCDFLRFGKEGMTVIGYNAKDKYDPLVPEAAQTSSAPCHP